MTADDTPAYVRGFKWMQKSYYANAETEPDIFFGMYSVDNAGCSGEICMHWGRICGEDVPRLKAYNDAWAALALSYDVIKALAVVDGKNITQEQFVKLLTDRGFKDMTEYCNPAEKEKGSRSRLTIHHNSKSADHSLCDNPRCTASLSDEAYSGYHASVLGWRRVVLPAAEAAAFGKKNMLLCPQCAAEELPCK